MTDVLTDEEITKGHSGPTITMSIDELSIYAKAIERAVLEKIGKQGPVGLLVVEDCAKAEFSYYGHMDKGHYCLYTRPLPQQAAIPENFVEAFDHIIELLKYVPDRPVLYPEPTDKTLLRSIKHIVTKLRSLSASPKL